jgi:phage tail-like protein
MLGRSVSNGQAPPERPRSKDPHQGLRFWVEVEGIEIAGFTECSGLSVETEVVEYVEGGENTYVHKLPIRTKYSNVTLKRGVDEGQTLFKWYWQTSNLQSKRKNVTISIYTADGKLGRKWHLKEAYPIKWTGPDLKSDSGAVAIETVEFAHSGLLFSNPMEPLK